MSYVNFDNLSWNICGDFNCIHNAAEKNGGNPFQFDASVVGFHNFINALNLFDLGYHGTPFTWSNGQKGPNRVLERLDRFLWFSEWFHRFPQAKVWHLERIASDHNPIVIMTDSTRPKTRPRFYFEHHWLPYQEVQDLVEKACTTTSPTLSSVLHNIKTNVRYWSINTLGSLETKLRTEIANLEAMESSPNFSNQDESYLRNLHSQYWVTQRDLCTKWWAKASVPWLKWGDKNSKFFHNIAKIRKRSNTISQILDHNNSMVSDPYLILSLFTSFYHSLWANGSSCTAIIPEFISLPTIPTHLSSSLTQPFTYEEVTSVLSSLGKGKAPGPDGFTVEFYQTYWKHIGPMVFQHISQFQSNTSHHLAALPFDWGKTKLIFIPKGKSPSTIKDYRPISLCNVLYRLISKCFANRIRPIMSHIISPNQSAFIPTRNIHDNIFLVQEVLHSIFSAQNKIPFQLLKLDMEKAFDRVSWTQILYQMNFPKSFINAIISCISSAYIHCDINGLQGQSFHNNQGLRQGDPLSPYLFDITSQLFSSLLNHASDCRLITPFISKHGFEQHHVMFADDLLIVMQASQANCQHLLHILDIYQSVTNQKINHSKSSVFFGPHIPPDLKNNILSTLHMDEAQFPMKYLAPSISPKRIPKSTFDALVSKVSDRANGWLRSSLGQAGRICLKHSISNSVPIHTMCASFIPDSTIKDFSKVNRRTLWSSKPTTHGLSLTSWENATTHRALGGLGIRDLSVVKVSVLGSLTCLIERITFGTTSPSPSTPILIPGLITLSGGFPGPGGLFIIPFAS